MGYLLVIIVCAIIGAWLLWWDELSVLGFILGGLVGCLVALLVGAVITSGAKTVETQTGSKPLYALDNGSGVSGAFFLGSGVINKTQQYTYLVNTDRGMQIQSVDVDNAYVKEDNNQKPQIITYTSDFDSPALRYWFPDMNSNDSYTFIIPKGSVKYNYNVDVSK